MGGIHDNKATRRRAQTLCVSGGGSDRRPRAAAGSFAATLLSYVLSAQEGVFVTWAEAAGIIWTAILLFVTQMTLHEFSFGKTLGVLLLTLAGVIIMIFLLLLFCSLMQEVYGFGSTLYYEIYFRWFVG